MTAEKHEPSKREPSNHESSNHEPSKHESSNHEWTLSESENHESSNHEWSLNVCEELLCCESYIYDFDTDIYGDYIEVELLEFVRHEMKFDSIDDLKAQMGRDIESGRKYHLAIYQTD